MSSISEQSIDGLISPESNVVWVGFGWRPIMSLL